MRVNINRKFSGGVCDHMLRLKLGKAQVIVAILLVPQLDFFNHDFIDSIPG